MVDFRNVPVPEVYDHSLKEDRGTFHGRRVHRGAVFELGFDESTKISVGGQIAAVGVELRGTIGGLVLDLTLEPTVEGMEISKRRVGQLWVYMPKINPTAQTTITSIRRIPRGTRDLYTRLLRQKNLLSLPCFGRRSFPRAPSITTLYTTQKPITNNHTTFILFS